jgi:hypothetical protein
MFHFRHFILIRHKYALTKVPRMCYKQRNSLIIPWSTVKYTLKEKAIVTLTAIKTVTSGHRFCLRKVTERYYNSPKKVKLSL